VVRVCKVKASLVRRQWVQAATRHSAEGRAGDLRSLGQLRRRRPRVARIYTLSRHPRPPKQEKISLEAFFSISIREPEGYRLPVVSCRHDSARVFGLRDFLPLEDLRCPAYRCGYRAKASKRKQERAGALWDGSSSRDEAGSDGGSTGDRRQETLSQQVVMSRLELRIETWGVYSVVPIQTRTDRLLSRSSTTCEERSGSQKSPTVRDACPGLVSVD